MREDTVTHVLMALAILALYLLYAAARPRKRCRTCRGWGAKGHRRRRAACTRCGGTGTRFRLAAVLLYRGAAAVTRQLRARKDGA